MSRQVHQTVATTSTDTAEGWIDRPEMVSRATAEAWLDQHDVCSDEFFEEYGDREMYSSRDVFIWLGY